MPFDSLRRKIFDLAYSEDISDSLRFQLLRFLTMREMDFLKFEDIPNMRAYFQRLKNLFTQHEMYDGYLTEEEKCEVILAPLVGGYLTSEDAIVHNPGNHRHVATLMAELLAIEEVRGAKASVRARGKRKPPVKAVYERKNKKLKLERGSVAEASSGSSSSFQSSTDSLPDSGVSA